MIVNKSEYVVVGNEDTGGIWEVKTLSNQTNSGASATAEADITLQNKMTGESVDVIIDGHGTGTVDLGTQTFGVAWLDDRDTEGDEYVRLRYQDGSRTTADNAVIFPTIETTKGAKVAFYEPIVINVTNWDGTGSHTGNLSQINFPDGDGFTAVTVAWAGLTHNAAYNFSTTQVLTNGTASHSATIGQLTYSIATNFSDSNTGCNGAGEVCVLLQDASGAGVNITEPALVIFEEQDDSSGQNYEAIIVKVEGSGTTSASIGISDVQTTWGLDGQFDEVQMQSDTDLYKSADFWGSIITTDQSDTDSYVATISYPDDQSFAEVYFADATASISGGAGGDGGALGSVTVKDTEVSSVSGKNLVVIGGGCVNTVAASLLGSDTPLCSGGFESATGVGSGSFLIETFTSPFSDSKVATLVAGYNAGDTTNAATYLRTQNPSTDAGDKYIGTSATSASMVTA